MIVLNILKMMWQNLLFLVKLYNRGDKMERMVRVSFRGKILKEFPAGTTFKEIAESFSEYFKYI